MPTPSLEQSLPAGYTEGLAQQALLPQALRTSAPKAGGLMPWLQAPQEWNMGSTPASGASPAASGPVQWGKSPGQVQNDERWAAYQQQRDAAQAAAAAAAAAQAAQATSGYDGGYGP